MILIQKALLNMGGLKIEAVEKSVVLAQFGFSPLPKLLMAVMQASHPGGGHAGRSEGGARSQLVKKKKI